MTPETRGPVGLDSATGRRERTTPNARQIAETASSVNGAPAKISRPSPLEMAKAILPDILALADALQWPIDGPGLTYAWYRGNSNTPSLSISEDCVFWKDFATGHGGDAIKLLEEVEKLDRKQACRRFMEIAGQVQRRMSSEQIMRCYHNAANPPSPEEREDRRREEEERRDAEREERRQGWVPFSILSEVEISQIIQVRRWPESATTGLTHASELGILVRSSGRGVPCYAVTDRARLSAKERRLDGLEVRPGVKSACLPGSLSRWPLGTAVVVKGDRVILVEGETDQLAMYALIGIFAPQTLARTVVVSLAAGTSIHDRAIDTLRARAAHVTVIADADDAGRAAACKWLGQLQAAGIPCVEAPIEGLVEKTKDISDLLSALNQFPELSPRLQNWVTSVLGTEERTNQT